MKRKTILKLSKKSREYFAIGIKRIEQLLTQAEDFDDGPAKDRLIAQLNRNLATLKKFDTVVDDVSQIYKAKRKR